jgi:glycosyltransferase involved in cell wall biosynthesis
MLKILHLIPSVGQLSFGLGPVVLNLAVLQNHYGGDSQIWCLDNHDDLLWASSTSGLEVERIKRFERIGLNAFGLSFAMERAAVSDDNKNIAIVHQHAIWTGISRVTCKMREKNKVSTIITPHGSLQKWALNKSRLKKKMALGLFERNNLNNASCLHAVGRNEISDFRDFGLTNPIAVIPNGVSNDWLNSRGDEGVFRHQFGIPTDKRIMLFLSRITPKKGLLMFLKVLCELKNVLNDWLFVIAGADEFNHQVEVERYIFDNRLNNHVIIVGPLFGQIKRDAYAAADILVLPSLSEGAPIVILEALGAEVPVLTTKASSWQDLESFNCGWWVDISTLAIKEALHHIITYSPDKLELMGQQGKKLVGDKYTWEKSAQMTIEMYNWLLGRGDRPEFVITD